MALAFDSLATTTLQLVRPRIADNVFLANAAGFWFLANGRVKIEGGGTQIEEPLEYAKNDTARSYSGWGKLNVKATDEFTSAVYSWKQFAGSVSISGLEGEVKNSGAQAQFNLLRRKIVNLEMSLKEFFNEMLLGDAAAKAADDFLGLDNLVEDVASGAQGTVGGINRQLYPWWENQVDLAVPTASLTSRLRSFVNTCSKGIARPDLLLSTQALYEAYEDQNAGKQIIRDNKLLDVGFENLRFKGITWMWDELVLNNHLYVLNSDFINVTIHRNRNFAMTPFQKPIDQDGKIAQILTAGNMTLNNSRHQGVMTFI